MKTLKKHIKATSINNITGEVHEVVTTQTEQHYRKPKNGYKGVYVNTLAAIIELSKPAQRLFFEIFRNVDDYNKLIAKWNTLSQEQAPNISKAKKELETAGFIAKIGKSWVLNPYVALPRYQAKAPENQYAVQIIYKRYTTDKDAWYQNIDEDARDLYGVELVDTPSSHITIGKGKSKKALKVPKMEHAEKELE